MGKAFVPVVETFSTQALERHVSNKILNNPLTLFPPILGVLGVGSAIIFGYGCLSLLAFAGYSFVVVGAGSFAVDKMFLRDKYWHDYIRKYNRKLKEQSANMVRYLEPELRKLDMSVAANQVVKLRRFYENFKTILDEKFFEHSSVRDRYLGVAEGLYVGSLGKLQLVLSKQRLVGVIDSDYINGRLDNMSNDVLDEKEAKTLHERLELKDKTAKEVQNLIEEVELAISGLADLSAKVAAITDASKDEAFEKIQKEAIRLAESTHMFESEKQL